MRRRRSSNLVSELPCLLTSACQAAGVLQHRKALLELQRKGQTQAKIQLTGRARVAQHQKRKGRTQPDPSEKYSSRGARGLRNTKSEKAGPNRTQAKEQLTGSARLAQHQKRKGRTQPDPSQNTAHGERAPCATPKAKRPDPSQNTAHGERLAQHQKRKGRTQAKIQLTGSVRLAQ